MSQLFQWEPPSWVGKEAWNAFVEMRKAKGKRAPFTDAARNRIIVELDRLRSQGNNPDEVLWQSVVNGWSGVFALKVDYNSARQQTQMREAEAEHMKREERKPVPMPDDVREKLNATLAKLRVH